MTSEIQVMKLERPPTILRLDVRDRYVGSGRLPAAISRVLSVLLATAMTVGLLNPYAYDVSAVVAGSVYAAVLLAILRSFRLGVYGLEDDIVIVTWFRTRWFHRTDIEAVLHRPYSGLITGGVGGNSFFNSRVQSLGFRIAGQDHVYEGTASSNRQLRSIARLIAGELGVSVVALRG